MSISSNLTRIRNAKTAIRAAINSKGGNLTDEKLGSYAAAILSLDTTTVLSTLEVTENGVYTAPTGEGYSKVIVSVSDVNRVHFDLTVGESFTVAIPTESSLALGVLAEPYGLLSWEEDGDELVFTALGVGVVTLTVGTDLGEGQVDPTAIYTVNIREREKTYDYSVAVGESFRVPYDDMEYGTSPAIVVEPIGILTSSMDPDYIMFTALGVGEGSIVIGVDGGEGMIASIIGVYTFKVTEA